MVIITASPVQRGNAIRSAKLVVGRQKVHLLTCSAIVLLIGTPSEIYVYGTQYVWIGIAYVGVMLISTQICLPVFYKLQVVTAYEVNEQVLSFLLLA